MGPVLGKLVSSTFDKKRVNPHSVLSPDTVLFILMKTVKLFFFFINLGLDLGRAVSRNKMFPWENSGNVHNIILAGFCKATQTSGFYDCQLEKIRIDEREDKNKNPVAALW